MLAVLAVVLVLFGVMLTRAKLGEDVNLTNDYWYVGAFTSIVLFAVMATSLADFFGDEPLDQVNASTQIPNNTEQVSDAIFSTYLVPFEVVSLPFYRRGQ